MAGKGYAAPQPNETLFVTGLPMNCTNEQAKGVFGQYGNVKSVTVMPVAAGKTAAAAFVIMETVDQAKWIVENLNGNIPGGLTAPVKVVLATPRDQWKGKGKGFGKMMGKGGGKDMMAGMMSMMSMMGMMMESMGKGGGRYGPY
mmetsp:Transcript_87006/g.106705  ORF Transcript_87006/g.106705 Transcript_87006/m.106705 type:complete len:144 (-) Transcript_87006:125-556(-)